VIEEEGLTMAQEYTTPPASLKAARDDILSKLTGEGVDLKETVPPLPKSGDFTWSCESLAAAAHAMYQLSTDAIAAHDIPTATHYYHAGQTFQQAHDAQCPEV
jgi:hypothetical protein